METRNDLLHSVIDIQSQFRELSRYVLSRAGMVGDVEATSSFNNIEKKLLALTKSVINVCLPNEASAPVSSSQKSNVVTTPQSVSTVSPRKGVSSASAKASTVAPLQKIDKNSAVSKSMVNLTCQTSSAPLYSAIASATQTAPAGTAPKSVAGQSPSPITASTTINGTGAVPKVGKSKKAKKNIDLLSCFKCLDCGKYLNRNSHTCSSGLGCKHWAQCTLCDVRVSIGGNHVWGHINGGRHKTSLTKLSEKDLSKGIEPKATPEKETWIRCKGCGEAILNLTHSCSSSTSQVFCRLCNVSMPTISHLRPHLEGKQHQHQLSVKREQVAGDASKEKTTRAMTASPSPKVAGDTGKEMTTRAMTESPPKVAGALIAPPPVEDLKQKQIQMLLKRASSTGSLPLVSQPPKAENSIKKTTGEPLITLRAENVPETTSVDEIKSLIASVLNLECVDAWMRGGGCGALVLTLTDARKVLLNWDKLSAAGMSFSLSLDDVYKSVFLQVLRMPDHLPPGRFLSSLPSEFRTWIILAEPPKGDDEPNSCRLYFLSPNCVRDVVAATDGATLTSKKSYTIPFLLEQAPGAKSGFVFVTFQVESDRGVSMRSSAIAKIHSLSDDVFSVHVFTAEFGYVCFGSKAAAENFSLDSRIHFNSPENGSSGVIVVTGVDERSPMRIPSFADLYNDWLDLLGVGKLGMQEVARNLPSASNGHFEEGASAMGEVQVSGAVRNKNIDGELKWKAESPLEQSCQLPSASRSQSEASEDLSSWIESLDDDEKRLNDFDGSVEGKGFLPGESEGDAAPSLASYEQTRRADVVEENILVAEGKVSSSAASAHQHEMTRDESLEATEKKNIASARSEIEHMKSEEEDFPTTHPGWPFCREWSQSSRIIQFTILFPNCDATSESASVDVSDDNYCLVRCQAPDGSECHWGTRLWRGVVKNATDVQVQDEEIRVKCQKEEVGLRWEKVGTARTRRF